MKQLASWTFFERAVEVFVTDPGVPLASLAPPQALCFLPLRGLDFVNDAATRHQEFGKRRRHCEPAACVPDDGEGSIR